VRVYCAVRTGSLNVIQVIFEITKFSIKYRDKLTAHPNELASTLLEKKKSLED
jgi:hypothetical protein